MNTSQNVCLFVSTGSGQRTLFKWYISMCRIPCSWHSHWLCLSIYWQMHIIIEYIFNEARLDLKFTNSKSKGNNLWELFIKKWDRFVMILARKKLIDLFHYSKSLATQIPYSIFKSITLHSSNLWYDAWQIFSWAMNTPNPSMRKDNTICRDLQFNYKAIYSKFPFVSPKTKPNDALNFSKDNKWLALVHM